jgi:Ca2+/Na+ antiporter
MREATIFLVIGAVALTLLVKDRKVGTYTGLVLGMIFYVGFVALLSKFGYERQSIRQARQRRATIAQTTASAQPGRQRPAPTRRTSTGPSQRPNRSTKKRRR